MSALVVADYDPAWPQRFDRIRDVVWPAVADVAIRCEHVGSTSVPGLAAKPVIDLDVVLGTDDWFPEVERRLGGLGYVWRGDLGVEGREAFDAPRDKDLARHHLYVVADGSRAYLDHVLLRDLLRGDEHARSAYADLKRELAAATDDVEVYTARKAAFVADLLARARHARGLPAVTYWSPTPRELGR